VKCTDIGAPEASGSDASHDPDVGLPPLPHKRFSSRLLAFARTGRHEAHQSADRVPCSGFDNIRLEALRRCGEFCV